MATPPTLPMTGQILQQFLVQLAEELAALSGRTITWNDVQGKPTTFAPGAHQHPVGDITGLQTLLNGKADTGAIPTTETIQDIVAAMFQTGTHSGLAFEYDDPSGKLNVTATCGGGVLIPREDVEDIVGALIQVQGTGLTVTYDDAGNVLRIGLAGEVFTTLLRNKLDALPSSFKTVGGQSIAGSGDIPLSGYDDEAIWNAHGLLEDRVTVLEGGTPVIRSSVEPAPGGVRVNNVSFFRGHTINPAIGGISVETE